jgi:hypothetical protein
VKTALGPLAMLLIAGSNGTGGNGEGSQSFGACGDS